MHGLESFARPVICLCDWLSEWLLLGVGETDEEVAKRLQASFDTEAGTDSHAAVRAGARPSQAVPQSLHTHMSDTAPVTHFTTLTLVPACTPPEAFWGPLTLCITVCIDHPLTVQARPGPLQSGAYPAIQVQHSRSDEAPAPGSSPSSSAPSFK